MAPPAQTPRPGPPRLRPPRSTAARIGWAAGGVLVVWWLLSGPALNFLGTLLWIGVGLALIRLIWRRLRRVRVNWREVGLALIFTALIGDILDDWRRR